MPDVRSLPPPTEIADPSARAFCEAVFNLIEARSGNIEGVRDERFITAQELRDAVGDELLSIFRGGTNGVRPPNPTSGTIGDRFRDIQRDIMNSELWRVLGEEFKLLTIPRVADMIGPLADGITALNNVTTTSSSKTARTLAGLQVTVGDAQAQIAAINEVSASSGSANARYLFALNTTVGGLAGDLGAVSAGLTNEVNARVNNRNALLTAINTIWASFGSTTSAISQSGDSLQSNALASQATKWDQVQSAVRDPNTGQIAAASILSEYRTYAGALDGKLSAMYTMRVEVQSGSGRPYVGGFGIEGGISDITAYPTIDFGVRADRFWVGSPSGGGEQVVPFVVITTPGQVVDGVTYNDVGVWMSSAMIANATIDFAQITDTLRSDVFSSGSEGWAIYKNGFAEFNNVVVRGTIIADTGRVNRLIIDGAVEGSVFVPNNGSASVPHNENRPVMVTLWVPGSTGQLAYIADMDLNGFSVRCALAGDTTVHYRYW